MVSTRGRYALRVMLDMAKHGSGEWQYLNDVAQRQQLSKKYLESIMAALIRVRPKTAPAAVPATATRVFSGRDWMSRSMPISTAIRWRSSCE